jgi:hypothetical protein
MKVTPEMTADTAFKIQNSKRTIAKSPYDGITREVFENKGACPAQLLAMSAKSAFFDVWATWKRAASYLLTSDPSFAKMKVTPGMLMKTMERGKVLGFTCEVPAEKQETGHRDPGFLGSAKTTIAIIQDSKRTVVKSPYDGITREVSENKGARPTQLRAMSAKSAFSDMGALGSGSCLLPPDFWLLFRKNEGDSGDVDENTGARFGQELGFLTSDG